jgi:hypothetical protein
MKTSELEGKDLDYWVAKAQGWEQSIPEIFCNQCWQDAEGAPLYTVRLYTPSTNGGQCFELMKLDSFRWVEKLRGEYNAMFNQLDKDVVVTSGPTLNIAICRAFVASVYGEESEK